MVFAQRRQVKGYSVTHGDEREIGVLHDVNVLTEKVLLVDRLHLLTDSSHSDPCLPTRLDDPKWWSLPESSVGVVWSNQWSNQFPSCCCLGENDVQKNPCCIKLGRLLQEFPANQPDQPTWPLFNDDQRLSLGPNYWSESWNSNEAINSLNLPGRHATPHSINFKEHPLFVWFILGILRVYLGRNSRTKTLKNSM